MYSNVSAEYKLCEEPQTKSMELLQMEQNECYYDTCAKAIAPNNTKSQTTKPSKKKLIFFLLAILIFIIVASIVLAVAAYVDIVKVKNQLNSSYSYYANLSSRFEELTTNTDSELKALREEISYNFNSTNTIQQLVNHMQMFHIFDSCASITTISLPFSSGIYWIRSSDNSAVQVYCNTLSCNGVTGGWRRVAYLNTSDSGPIQCPSGLQIRIEPPSCRRNHSSAGCSSIFYSSHDILYSCIYGRVNAQQTGSLDGFRSQNFTVRPNTPMLEKNYVDGISLTHGLSPRKHIWTFSSTFYWSKSVDCTACNYHKPDFIGNDLSCEANRICTPGQLCFNQLWNGGPQQCFSNATFYRELPQPTTDDIELRVCRDEDRNNEDLLVTFVELYVL